MTDELMSEIKAPKTDGSIIMMVGVYKRQEDLRQDQQEFHGGRGRRDLRDNLPRPGVRPTRRSYGGVCGMNFVLAGAVRRCGRG